MRFLLGFGLAAACAAMALVSGCGSSDESPPGGVPSGSDAGDASVVPEGGADGDGWIDTGPSCDVPSFLGPATRSSDGVLTNHPEFHFTKTGGSLDITTAYFDMLKTPTFNSLAMYGDVVNNTKVQQCVPYVDQFKIDMQDLSTNVDGPAYELEGSKVTLVCLEPGARGIFRAIQNDIDPALIDTPRTLSYSITTYPTTPPNRRHPDEPAIVSASPLPGENGWTLKGRLRAGPKEINTLEVFVYVRDPNGLVYNLFRALPGDLHTIAPGSELDFETAPNPAQFCGYELFTRFIDGPEAPMPDGGSSDAADGQAGD
jgi:hypothetical protein